MRNKILPSVHRNEREEETEDGYFRMGLGRVDFENMAKDFQEEGREIVFSWIYKNLILKVISWLTGKDYDIDLIIPLVREAEDTFQETKTGKQKAAWVADQVIKILPTVATWIVNLLIELAVAYCKKQGWIK